MIFYLCKKKEEEELDFLKIGNFQNYRGKDECDQNILRVFHLPIVSKSNEGHRKIWPGYSKLEEPIDNMNDILFHLPPCGVLKK